ncbi:5-(carboxyamino)imidazole ribonucleotide synthase [Picrophilus oshimae]|uniref:N5-carboxyaminoimidazole ribonucleotide synthase n=1 Tax=Picrophilus torridus (strain ATCC 700027 / DSM 9790 / JCM 10055 / NBRC 100828 / KAW 2/3) TaxID=1122961 RepID=Q6KYZ2_PICTO|nr:5-(carboxyamino)imidazole ribonucleotide synthase [Picrophilus oshimae]AAT44060.1 phosphoribosylaminoimidazole carboxylase ATPase subunit [Picrophilus oshimae DSM 9789]
MKIGIIGSGQLGWMMMLESYNLPVDFYMLDNEPGPASYMARKFFTPDKYKEFVDSCDYITYEFEHVDGRTLEYSEKSNKLRPGLKAIEIKRDRSLEKDFLRSINVPEADYEKADNFNEALKMARDKGNAVIKTCAGGYDGKGQFYVHDSDTSKFEGLDVPGRFIVEDFINYESEASIIAVRSESGEFQFFDPSFNYNKNGILIYNIAPFNDKKSEMQEIAKKIMNNLNYIGVMGIEFYIVNNKVLVNEIAPRVHNTGHHTLKGSSISQFQEHIRAISNMNIIRPELYKPSGIVNILGRGIDDVYNEIMKTADDVYWYRKPEIRRKRKMGHVNITGESYSDVNNRVNDVLNILYRGNLDQFI